MRLTDAPNASEAHPKTVIPSIANAIDPVLKTLKTLARSSFGVRSCNEADTKGVISPELPPITAINAAANGSGQWRKRTSAAPPPTAEAVAITNIRRQTCCSLIRSRPVVATRIPMLKDDQSQPSPTDPTCRI